MGYLNIMLIDDDEDDQEIFLAALDQISTSVHCTAFSAAREALKKLIAGEINPEVIFLDLNMPVMNGQQFLLEIKKTEGLRNIPVIIFSTSSHAGTIELTKELGAYDFITKPNNFEGLINILKPIID
ncbi:MAG: response regulator receiver protein [Bacteroidetes bacterium]|nr:response regulator receiver protein [Bacteroidota bacterium]